MAYQPAIRSTSSRLLRALRQREGTTGNRLSPEQTRAIVEGGLEAESRTALARARLAEERRQFDESMGIRRKALEAENRAAAISGIVDLGATGYEAFVLAPKAIAAERRKAEAIEGLTKNVTPSGTDIFTGIGGETSGAEALTAAPETFTSASTGEAVSTTTGEALPGLTAGSAFGTFVISDVVSNLVGEGQGKVASGAVSGAVTGTYLFPGVGTVAGTIIGGLSGLLNADDGTVICQELYRQRYLSHRILKLDQRYAELFITTEEYLGYRFFADPIVEKMKKSKPFTLMIKPFAIAWAYTMANKIDKKIKVNRVRKFIGNVLLNVGRPLCRWNFKRFCEKGVMSCRTDLPISGGAT